MSILPYRELSKPGYSGLLLISPCLVLLSTQHCRSLLAFTSRLASFMLFSLSSCICFVPSSCHVLVFPFFLSFALRTSHIISCSVSLPLISQKACSESQPVAIMSLASLKCCTQKSWESAVGNDRSPKFKSRGESLSSQRTSQIPSLPDP